MRELAIRTRVLLGSMPIGFQRLFDAALGWLADSSALRAAVPWLLAATAGLACGLIALTLAGIGRDYPLVSGIGGGLLGAWLLLSLPRLVRPSARPGLTLEAGLALAGAIVGGGIGIVLAKPMAERPEAAAVAAGVLVGAATARRLRVRRAVGPQATFDPVAALVWLLAVLTIVPVLQAGAEIIITRSSVPEFVRRQVSLAQLVDIHGYALLMPLPAEAPIAETGALPGSYRWLLLREGVPDLQMAMVRTQLDLSAVRRQQIVARVRTDIDVEAAGRLLGQRGIRAAGALSDVALQVVAEPASGQSARDIGSLNELASTPGGSVVRVTLDFSGHGVAACALADACQARRLARGVGPWLQLASDGAGASAFVQVSYPPTVAPIDLVGRQQSDLGATSRLLDSPQLRLLLGWAQIQRRAEVEHDPDLPVDRLWLGPILFSALAALLLLGRRVGYPIFQATGRPARRWQHGASAVDATASGWLSSPGRSPLELDRVPVRLLANEGTTTIEVPDGTERLAVAVPRALGALSGIEAGQLRHLGSSQPTLRVGWYGSQLELVFATVDDRDTAGAMLAAA